jgi:hypothetical protein
MCDLHSNGAGTLSAPAQRRLSSWATTVGAGGVAWNLFGLVQYQSALTATAENLVASGLTPDQAAAMTGYPGWMTLAFGIGVVGGLVGSALLLLRHRLAPSVLWISLMAYVALWIGDAVHGVFAAMGAAQVIILSTVVAIAAQLFATSRHAALRA